jgi:hypothetical protein
LISFENSLSASKLDCKPGAIPRREAIAKNQWSAKESALPSYVTTVNELLREKGRWVGGLDDFSEGEKLVPWKLEALGSRT